MRCSNSVLFQMRAVVLGVMRKRKLKADQLGAVDLATLGHLLCGLTPSEINRLDPFNLRLVMFKKYNLLFQPEGCH